MSNKNLLIKSSILFYFSCAAALLSVLSLFHYLDRESDRHLWQQEETKIAYSAASGISNYIYEITGDLLILANQRELFSGDTLSNQLLAEEFEQFSKVRHSYYQIRFIDIKGDEIVRINYEGGLARRVPVSELQNKSHRPYFTSTINLSPRDVYVSEFDLNIEKGEIERPVRPVIRFATPVYDGNGNKKGIIVINYNGEKILHYISSLDGQSKSQLMLLNEQGYWLYSKTISDRWGFQLPHKRNMSDDYPEWDDLSKNSIGQYFDHEWLFTHLRVGGIEAVDKIWLEKYTPAGEVRLFFAEKPWHVVSLADADLVYSESTRRLKYAAYGFLALLVLLIPPSIIWGRRRAQIAADKGEILASVIEIENSDKENRELLQQNRKITQQLLRANEEERRYIARELHDEFGQWLTIIQLESGIVSGLEQAKDPAIQSSINAIRYSAVQIHKGIRGMINTLRPALLDELGLTESLRELVAQWQSHNPDTHCELSLAEDLDGLGDETDITVYRVVQEALTNIAKYATASHVSISLHKKQCGPTGFDTLMLTIEDNGKGMDLSATNDGMGLHGMRERLISIGGKFHLDSMIGVGTRIDADFPVR